MEMFESVVVVSLDALAQEHRLAAFRALVRAGVSGMAAGDISGALGLAPSTMSFHLAQLEKAGLIKATRHGRSLVYAAQFEVMAALVGYLTDQCCGGEACALTPNHHIPEASA